MNTVDYNDVKETIEALTIKLMNLSGDNQSDEYQKMLDRETENIILSIQRDGCKSRKARQRSDLLDDGEKINARSLGGLFEEYISLPDWVDSEQPEILNDEEFNTIVETSNGLFLVSSIDLDFSNSKTSGVNCV